MSTDFYLKMEPVKGESKAKGHEGEIDILSFSFGATQPSLSFSGGGAGAGKVDVHDASFSHYVDLASAYLMSGCCKGTHFKKATLTCRKAGDDPLEFLIYTLEDVIITGVNTNGQSGGADHPSETFTLNFQKFTKKYTPQGDTGGSGEGGNPEFTYHIAKREASSV